MSHRRMAILEFSLGAIREALQLPEEAEILGAEVVFGQRDRLRLKIEGAGWPTQEGYFLRPTTAVVTRRQLADGMELMPEITWNFPTSTEQEE